LEISEARGGRRRGLRIDEEEEEEERRGWRKSEMPSDWMMQPERQIRMHSERSMFHFCREKRNWEGGELGRGREGEEGEREETESSPRPPTLERSTERKQKKSAKARHSQEKKKKVLTANP